jgi:hypothetical protein
MRTRPCTSALVVRRAAGASSRAAAIGTRATAMAKNRIFKPKTSDTAGLKIWPTVRV